MIEVVVQAPEILQDSLEFDERDIKNNASVAVNNDFWVRSEAICQ